MPAPVAQGATSSAVVAASIDLATPKRNDGTALVVGDTLWAMIAHGGGTTISAPAGWDLARGQGNGSNASLTLFRRNVGSSEPTSHTFTLSASVLLAGAMLAVSGAAPQAPEAINGQGAVVTGTAALAPSVTTLGADRLLVSFHHWGGGSLTGTSTASPPTGMAEKIERNSAGISPGKRLVEVNHVAQAAGGASGDKTAASSEPSETNHGILIALKEPVVPQVAELVGMVGI